MPEPVLGLQLLVAQEINNLGNPTRLSKKIALANEAKGTGLTVDRRKLEKLATNPDKINITLRMLKALEVYFASKGKSLKGVPIFTKFDLIDSLVEKKKVTFFLGSKPRRGARRNDISRWDTRSLARLISRVSVEFQLHMNYDIEDVLLETPMDEKVAKGTEWYKLFENSSCSLVSIGSPKACHASEVMLARMCGISAFDSAIDEKEKELRVPFAFLWHRMPPGRFRSSFCLSHRQMKLISGKVRIADVNDWQRLFRKRASAFVTKFPECNVAVVPVGPTEWDAYGMIVAQRRAGGNLWVVLAGITGPATYAAAELVGDIQDEVPQEGPEDGRVLMQPIAVTIKTDPRCKAGDNREIKNPRLLGRALLWKPGTVIAPPAANGAR